MYVAPQVRSFSANPLRKSLHVRLFHYSPRSVLMDVLPVTVLLFVEWTPGHDLLHRRPHSERPLILRARSTGSPE